MSDDGSSKYLWNVGKLLPAYAALQPRRQPSSSSPPWEPQILQPLRPPSTILLCPATFRKCGFQWLPHNVNKNMSLQDISSSGPPPAVFVFLRRGSSITSMFFLFRAKYHSTNTIKHFYSSSYQEPGSDSYVQLYQWTHCRYLLDGPEPHIRQIYLFPVPDIWNVASPNNVTSIFIHRRHRPEVRLQTTQNAIKNLPSYTLTLRTASGVVDEGYSTLNLHL
jgi:hypothetical protein